MYEFAKSYLLDYQSEPQNCKCPMEEIKLVQYLVPRSMSTSHERFLWNVITGRKRKGKEISFFLHFPILKCGSLLT